MMYGQVDIDDTLNRSIGTRIDEMKTLTASQQRSAKQLVRLATDSGSIPVVTHSEGAWPEMKVDNMMTTSKLLTRPACV
jgi:hypothetical protein